MHSCTKCWRTDSCCNVGNESLELSLVSLENLIQSTYQSALQNVQSTFGCVHQTLSGQEEILRLHFFQSLDGLFEVYIPISDHSEESTTTTITENFGEQFICIFCLQLISSGGNIGKDVNSRALLSSLLKDLDSFSSSLFKLFECSDCWAGSTIQITQEVDVSCTSRRPLDTGLCKCSQDRQSLFYRLAESSIGFRSILHAGTNVFDIKHTRLGNLENLCSDLTHVSGRLAKQGLSLDQQICRSLEVNHTHRSQVGCRAQDFKCFLRCLARLA